mgnify:CR=1 FL=1
MSNTAMQEQDYEKDVKVDFSIWKRLLSYVFRYKKTAIALMLCNVGIAVIDILYPLMSQYAIDNFVEKGTTAGIGWFIALYIAFIALQALGVYSFIVKAGKLEMSVSYDMRKEAFQKLQELSFSFYDRTAVGYLMARMISDVGSLSEMMAWSFVDLLWASTYVIGVVIAMFAMNWKLALVPAVLFPVIIIYSLLFHNSIRERFTACDESEGVLSTIAQENLTGVRVVRAFGREEYERQKNVYVLDTEKMSLAKPTMKVLHPLPRVDEITPEVDEDPRAVYFKQARNGVYTRMALILTLLGDHAPSVTLFQGGSHSDEPCANPNCITNQEHYLKRSFLENSGMLVCEYCEHKKLI